MLIYKKIIKHRDVNYYLTMDRTNSRKCYIEAHETGKPYTNNVASIDNKTGIVDIFDKALPQKVINKINMYGAN